MERLIGKKKKDGGKSSPEFDKIATGFDSKAEEREARIRHADDELRKLRDQMRLMRDGPAKDAVKHKALRLLAQRRRYQQQAELLRQQAFNLEQAHFAVQSAKDTKETVAAMRDGVRATQKHLNKTNLEEVDRVYDDLTDLMETTDEMNEALGRPAGTPTADQDELEAELAALGEDILQDQDTSYLEAALSPGRPQPAQQHSPPLQALSDVTLPRLPDEPL